MPNASANMILASSQSGHWIFDSLGLFWVAVIAGFGAAIVLAGVYMEVRWEKPWYKNISDFRRSESIKHIGGWLVVGGLVWEVVFGVGIAIKDELETRKNDPWNGSISEISADLYFETNLTNGQDVVVWNPANTPVLMALGEGEIKSSNGVIQVPSLNSRLPMLSSPNLVRMWTMPYGSALQDGSILQDHASYSLNFRSAGMGGVFTPNLPVSGVTNVSFLWMEAPFLPTNCEIKTGVAKIFINGRFSKSFPLPKQTPFGTLKILIATNFNSSEWK